MSTTPTPENGPADRPAFAPRRMNPKRFVIGQRVMHRNHVMGYDIQLLEVAALLGEFVICSPFFGGGPMRRFTSDGIATWSPNLSIVPARAQPKGEKL